MEKVPPTGRIGNWTMPAILGLRASSAALTAVAAPITAQRGENSPSVAR